MDDEAKLEFIQMVLETIERQDDPNHIDEENATLPQLRMWAFKYKITLAWAKHALSVIQKEVE